MNGIETEQHSQADSLDVVIRAERAAQVLFVIGGKSRAPLNSFVEVPELEQALQRWADDGGYCPPLPE